DRAAARRRRDTPDIDEVLDGQPDSGTVGHPGNEGSHQANLLNASPGQPPCPGRRSASGVVVLLPRAREEDMAARKALRFLTRQPWARSSRLSGRILSVT